MFGRLAHVLLAFVVALAATMPAGARAMPMTMPRAIGGTGLQQHCPTCPPRHSTGANPEKMPPCSILACPGAVATLPNPALLPERIPLQTAYLSVLSVRWTAAVRTPDPFPPRAIALD